MPNIKRPITIDEGLRAIASIQDIDPAVNYTLRMLLCQLFRDPTGMGEFADDELSMIYAQTLDEQQEGDIIDVEVVKEEDRKDFTMSVCPMEDPTPPDYSANQSPALTLHERTKFFGGPIHLACTNPIDDSSVSKG